jgi:glycosyltransferase involved in cell wall biosynthesis
MKIVALLQVHNEQRFLATCLDHLAEQGVSVYVIDNESTDNTVSIAEQRLNGNVIGIETLPRSGTFALREQLRRKEELASELEADWFIHQDADELRVSPESGKTLAEAIEQIDAAGFNAVNFIEFVFMPTVEHPDHDHPEFAHSMRSYYPYIPRLPHRLNAWKRQDAPVKLAGGGHLVQFDGLRMAPQSMHSRHYLFLSLDHAYQKFGPGRRYAPEEIKAGWHRWRAALDPQEIILHSEKDLRTFAGDHLLDASEPFTQMSQLVNTDPLAGNGHRWWKRAQRRGRSSTESPS